MNSLVTLAPVKKDEELSCDYGYSPSADLPWFREEYKRFQRENGGKARRGESFDKLFWEAEAEIAAEQNKIGRSKEESYSK